MSYLAAGLAGLAAGVAAVFGFLDWISRAQDLEDRVLDDGPVQGDETEIVYTA